VAAGLAIVIVATPVVVLMPAFWLVQHLPPDAGLTRFVAPVMALTLIALTLTAAVNVIGGAIATGRSLLLHRRGRPR
jgi:hypothetical protein